MKTDLTKYLKEDAQRRKKIEEDQDERRTLRNIKEKYESSEPLTVDDIKISTKILFKLIKESYENKDSFLNCYIVNEKLNLDLLKSDHIDIDKYNNNKQEYLHTYTVYTSVVSCSRSARTLYRAEPTRLLVHYIEQTLSTTRHYYKIQNRC